MQLSPLWITIALAGMLLQSTISQADNSQILDEESAARSCGTESPRLLSLGEGYYEIPGITEHTGTESLRHHDVIEAITSQRFRSGHGTRVVCFGGDTQPRAKISQITLKDIQQRPQYRDDDMSLPELSIRLFEYDSENRQLRPQTIFIVTDAPDISTPNNSSLTMRYRHRQRSSGASSTGYGGNSVLRETELQAKQTDQGLVIQQTLFVNGFFAEWVTWTLSTRT